MTEGMGNMGNGMQGKPMKRAGYKVLSCLLAVYFICLTMTGCGTAGNANGEERNGRQVVTIAVLRPSGAALDQISAYNESNTSCFVEIKEYEETGSVMDDGEWGTQLTLDILSGKGPDLVIWDSYSYTPALASEKQIGRAHV